MYKLVILFQPPFAWATFEQGWQKFLGMAEQMPGLRKEAVGDIEQLVFGPPNMNYKKVHELYFDSREALEEALKSEAGQKAGQWLHSFTQGRFLLMVAKHMEATPEQFKKVEQKIPGSGGGESARMGTPPRAVKKQDADNADL